jgi:hypothetical protein
MDGVFIVLLDQDLNGTIAVQEFLYRKMTTGESSKTFHFFAPNDLPSTSQYRYRRHVRQALWSCRCQNFLHFWRVRRSVETIATLFRKGGQLSMVASS